MQKSKKHGENTTQKQISNSEPIIVDFNSRAICDQNFSKVIALPKTALANLGENITRVNVKLVQENGERYIKISPINNKGGDTIE